jgi:hypothetical protein
MTEEEYKLAKEAFVAGNLGMNIQEMMLMTMSVPVSVFPPAVHLRGPETFLFDISSQLHTVSNLFFDTPGHIPRWFTACQPHPPHRCVARLLRSSGRRRLHRLRGFRAADHRLTVPA